MITHTSIEWCKNGTYRVLIKAEDGTEGSTGNHPDIDTAVVELQRLVAVYKHADAPLTNEIDLMRQVLRNRRKDDGVGI